MSYEDIAHTLMAAAHWQAKKNLTLSLGLAYSMSESTIKDVFFVSDPHTDGDRLDAETPWKGTYDLANTNALATYSDLEYNILDLSLGAEYALSDTVNLNVEYLLTDVDDQEAYVYGDESGLYHSLRAWVTFRF